MVNTSILYTQKYLKNTSYNKLKFNIFENIKKRTIVNDQFPQSFHQTISHKNSLNIFLLNYYHEEDYKFCLKERGQYDDCFHCLTLLESRLSKKDYFRIFIKNAS